MSMVKMVTIICDHCGEEGLRRAWDVNYARENGKKMFCSKSCANKAKPITKEQKIKMSLAKKDKPLSEKNRNAIKEAMNRPDVKEKVSKGVQAAYEDPIKRENMIDGSRKAHQTEAFREKRRIARLGTTLSEEHKQKIAEQASIVQKAYWATLSPEQRRERMDKMITAAMTVNVSSLEKNIKAILEDMEVAFISQHPIGRFTVDFFFPEQKTVLEIFGCYWHGCDICKKNKDEDQARKKRHLDHARVAYLKACGYTVFILWEHDIHRLSEVLNTILS